MRGAQCLGWPRFGAVFNTRALRLASGRIHSLLISNVFPLLAAVTQLSCASDRDSNTSTNGYSGARLYQVYCSSCHGADARGNGPVSPFIKVPVPDLTHIAAANGGEFPAEKVYRVIDGQSGSTAHGERHMPVWGYEFFGDEGTDQSAHQRATDEVDSLVIYLRSMQQSK